MPITATPGQTFPWQLTFKNPKNGYAGVFRSVGGFQVETPEGQPFDWWGYAAQALTPVVPFNGATTATLQLTAPSTPGSYTVQNIVPADGGTVGSDTVVVAPGATTSPASVSTGAIAGMPAVVVIGTGLALLLLLLD